MTAKKWQQNILLVSSDSDLKKIITDSFGEESSIQIALDGDDAIQAMELHQYKVFILDDKCLAEDTVKWTPGISALDICHEAHKNHAKPKIMILSDHIETLGTDYLEKTNATLIMNRKHISPNRIIHLIRMLRNRTYRTILSRDFIKSKTFKCPLYKFNPHSGEEKGDNTGYDLFLQTGVTINEEHLKELISDHVYHLYVKENELHQFIDSFPAEMRDELFSSKLNNLRKDYRTFLLDFSDGTKIGNKKEGDKTYEKGLKVINQLSDLIGSFSDPLTCLKQLPYPRKSELSHGLNSALYTLLFGRLCELKESPKEIALAALIHNIGIMDVDQTIVMKNHQKLSPEEKKQYIQHVHHSQSIAKRHTAFSSDLFNNVLLYHHENCDGSGYPEGLPDEKIPDEAKLVAIASSYNYIKTQKVGEKIKTPKEAFEILKSLKGKYNLNILQCMETLFK
jgi:HD-GYP domain-containing protein (c-di-GMP phosphodiesterase class II)